MSHQHSPVSASEHSSYTMGSGSPAPSHLSTATSFSSASPTSSSSKIDMSPSNAVDASDYEQPKPITCRWDNCGLIFYDPEVVYKHLCDDHVGRKSTNNLCLTCKWEGCDVSCAKRDHITSHVRVHTPLKPHNCDVCGKTFKRPQDLKKHERIHTEQHQQHRQQKAAQNAAARSFPKPDHLSYNSNPYPPLQDTGLPGAPNGYYHPMAYGAAPPQNPGLYPSPTPAYGIGHGHDHYAHSVTSSASLSPMSSRLETPQGSSPVIHPVRQEPGSYMHLTSSVDGRGKTTTDPTSYTYLAKGANASQHLAGSKRGHEQVEDFFGDLRRKKMAPAYDANMAERLSQTFGSDGLDEMSLQAILSGFEQTPLQAQPSIPFAPRPPVKQEPADLAQLNSFLLQLGASAARDFGSFSSTSSTNDYHTPADFDLSSLSQFGLNTIPGFDESIFSNPVMSQNGQRAIAHLPSRAGKGDEAIGYSAGYPYNSQQQPASFDSVRLPRGVGVVPQLGAMDAGGHSYRRVEALTRAAPEESMERSTQADEEDKMSEAKPTADQLRNTDRYRSISPAGSSESGHGENSRRSGTPTSHGLYPRVSPQASVRRPPSGSAHESDTARQVSHSRRTSVDTDARTSPAPSSPSMSSLYPNLIDRVSRMEGLGRPSRSSSSDGTMVISEAKRLEHIRLIRDLLVAINFPARARAESGSRERIRLAPILTSSISKKGAIEEGETTPSSRRSDIEFMHEVESDRASTPTPPGRPTLPTLSQLLNNVPEAHRPIPEREMECDV